MTLRELCEKNRIKELIDRVRESDEYLAIDEKGNLCFYYLTVAFPEAPVLANPNPTLLRAYKQRFLLETDGVLSYSTGEIPIHKSIVQPFCSGLHLDTSETSATAFVEWCYCGTSLALIRATPFTSVRILVELLKCPQARMSWKFFESYSLYLSAQLPDVVINFLEVFDNVDMIEDHTEMFQTLSILFFSTFSYNGGSDFLGDLPKSLLISSLKCLIKDDKHKSSLLQ
ncbi:hypothetical protein EIN_377640 [Entamoeba invadens IP1]|uniref:BTB domain-containing protein n=1 Tax=Entamoeba invadens IP1 TaxID=370355 RepID=A0A0A1TU98_ENTIV|nr:hypothetical protein EIN_377640 [Entamoeba invadens IP1]ELP83509.1 hypothetical protein EIN_377640 [Entamoeba invadens IP1]|eukprot:XP_004182855.1 hypothetical protein EIN_377640 [Entamoeba invadens IP1]